LRRAHHAALVATGGLNHDHVNVRGLHNLGRLVPSFGIVRHPSLLTAHAAIEVGLAHIDTSIEPYDLTRNPTLLMQVHDRQLFGLHG
jgi:hypothetical protein